MARIYADRVLEGSTTTGTGNLALAGASPGFQTFAAVAGIGDTFDYSVYAVDGSGVPTGDWETGSGTFAAGDQITRTPHESSNGGALVNFAAGSKVVILTENAVSIAALAAGGGGGSGSGVIGMYQKNGSGFGSYTANDGAIIPGFTFTFTLAEDTVCKVDFILKYAGDHGLRVRPRLDGTSWLPATGDPNNNFDFQPVSGPSSWYLFMSGTDLIPAGTHTLDVYYNAQSSTDGLTPINKSITVTPVTTS